MIKKVLSFFYLLVNDIITNFVNGLINVALKYDIVYHNS